MNAKELELSQQVRRETLMERFQGHRLLGLQYNETEKTDSALCECGWMYTANNAGGAFDYWVEHLIWVQSQQRSGQPETAESSASAIRGLAAKGVSHERQGT